MVLNKRILCALLVMCICIIGVVSAAAPVAGFTANQTTRNTTPMVVQFSDATTNSPTGWNWSFGDGYYSEEENPVHTYIVAADYNVTLIATNGDGANTSYKGAFIQLTSDVDQYVSSWMHFDPSPVQQFYDEMGLVWTVYDNASISTSFYKFEDGSGDFTNLKSGLHRYSYATLNFTTNDFTIEAWIYPTATINMGDIFSRTNNVHNTGWGLTSTSGTGNDYVFFMGTISNAANKTNTFAVPNNQWSYIVVERLNGVIYVYRNGTLVATKTGLTGNFDVQANEVALMYRGDGNTKVTGYLDEFRISNGIARYTSNFTVPFNEYTRVLYPQYPDVNPDSTFRFKVDPSVPSTSFTYNNTDIIERTLQIQNITHTDYIVGSVTTDPIYTLITDVHPNISAYSDITLVSSVINNNYGILEFNITRPGGFSTTGTERKSIIDWHQSYVNYANNTTQQTVYYTYGKLINTTNGITYPVHNFLATNLSYGEWTFTTDFTANTTTQAIGQPIEFTSSFTGSFPNRWNWSWGDGTYTDGVSANVTHTYTTAGEKTVSLKAYMVENESTYNISTKTNYITTYGTILANFTANATIGLTYPMAVQFTDTSSDTPTAWNWSFGDGRYSTEQNPVYYYAVAGKYNVTLNASNIGGSSTVTKQEFINLTTDDDEVDYQYLQSWIHFNGAEGSTDIVGQKGVAWWVGGNAYITTSTYKFGGASLSLRGNSYIFTPASSKFNMSTGKGEVEFWVKVNSSALGMPLIKRANPAQTEGWGITHLTSSALSDGWSFWMGNDVTGGTNTFTLPIGEWTHIAASADILGNNYVYVNGILVATKSGMTANYDTLNPIYLGYRSSGTTRYFDGEIDEFRLSTNNQRWTSNFTTPYAEYRGELEDPCPDININSTFRYKTDPTSYAIIANQTNYGDGVGIRNRTVQIEGVYNADYVVGTAHFNPNYTIVQNVYLNKSTYATGMTLVSSSIDNTLGLVHFNVSRTPGFNNGTVRASIIDYQSVYYNYHDPSASGGTTEFGEGYLINVSVNDVYPIHYFIKTPLTYMPWTFTADFTVSGTTTPIVNTTVAFNSTFIGAYPNRWNWSFGDGTYAESTEANITHVYTTLGLKTVSVREYMYQNTSVNSTKTRTNYLNITGATVANFTSNVTTGLQYPLVVQFNDTSSNTPISWNWSFGDGRYSTSQNPVYQYAVAGKYTVSLTATNAYGSNTVTKTDYINLTSDDDAYVISWLHMNGTSGQTTFNGEKGISWVTHGAAKISTSIYKYGNSAGDLTGSKSYLSTPHQNEFNFTTGDFTIELWARPTTSGNWYSIIQKGSSVLTSGWGIYHSTSSTSSNAWVFYMGTYTTGSTGTFSLPLNTWSHVVVERISGVVYVYVDGTLVASKTGMTGNYDTLEPIYLGYNPNKYFGGYMDEFRISVGVARWKSNFTTPYNQYRGVLETSYPDVNPYSTMRQKRDPTTPFTFINATTPNNSTFGNVRNRTIQIQNVTNTSYVIGSVGYDPAHITINAIRLNKSTYADIAFATPSIIDPSSGTYSFNVTRAGGLSAPGDTRVSLIDTECVYTNYAIADTTYDGSFSYGYLINGTTFKVYPIHNFINTPYAYGEWSFIANFTANVTSQPAGYPILFNSTFTGSYPNRWKWTFGDGTIVDGVEPNVSHTFTTAGRMNVTLMEYLVENTSVSSTITRDLYITVNPTASFTATPLSGSNDLLVQFTDTSTGNPATWNWSFGDGTYSTAQNPLHNYITSGNHTVTLNVYGLTGGSNSTTKTDYIQTTPLAQFIGTPNGGLKPLTVSFMDYSTGQPISWNWSFGDGEYSDEQNPVHVYVNNGNYDVTLSITGANSTTNTTTILDYITISDDPVVAGFVVVPTFGTVPLTVSFTDISTGNITNWNWTFGDGHYSDERNPIHTYDSIGNYQVTLNVSNAAKFNQKTIPDGVIVNAPSPVVSEFVGQPTTGSYPLSVIFTDLSYGYPTAWNWSFGDGNYSTEQIPTHEYVSAGSYTVTLIASNSYGTSTFVRPNYIVVSSPAAPVANFVATPIYGNNPLIVTFTDISMNTPTAWNWSFGDGEYSSDRNPSHTYTDTGTFSVTLIATNTYGSSSISRDSYIVTSNLVPTANLVGSPTYGVVPLYVSFTDVSNTMVASISAWNWSFGDGTYSTLQNPSHTYTTAGTYTVILTVGNLYGYDTLTRTDYIVGYDAPTPTPSPTPTPTIVPTLPAAPDVLVNNQSIVITAEIGEKYVQWAFANANRSEPLPAMDIYIDDSDVPVVTNYTGSTFLMSDLAPGERHNIRIYNSSAVNQTNVSEFLAKATAKTSSAGYEVMYLVALNLLLGVLLFILKDIRYLICLSVLNICISLMGMSLAGGVGLPYYLFIGCAVITVIVLLVNGIPRLREEVDWL